MTNDDRSNPIERLPFSVMAPATILREASDNTPRHRTTGCFSFNFCSPCSSSSSSHSASEPWHGSWWNRVISKIRDFSDKVVAPRWKTLVRSFSRKNDNNEHHSGGDDGWKTRSMARFQYDPMSYALNFDEGPEDEDAQFGHRDFSARFAAPTSA
ncbi:hypothetical protein ZIOFF_058975 [Zingiber officinale]|uniref:Uncharacterized protein n=2 Tax=Zingiber officinale TaxID=94328 RepID=A0A8J5KJD4_ZINOF|nr:hypothetical protein ZIOFF_058975 [Zingiber officinale]